MDTNDYLTLFISLLALAVSIVSALVAYRQQKTELRTTIRDQITSVVQELIATQAEMTVLNAEPLDKRDSMHVARMSSVNQKLTSLSRQACELDRLAPDVGFDVEFIAVANALATSGDIPVAEQYFKKAVEKSASSYYRVINLGLYANFLFEQSRHTEGRRHTRNRCRYSTARRISTSGPTATPFVTGLFRKPGTCHRPMAKPRGVTRMHCNYFTRSVLQA